LTALGCALWAVAFVLVGLLAGAAWAEVSSVLGRALLVLGIVVIAFSLLQGRHTRDGADGDGDASAGA
jgi:membrane protein DedA with SNARE-associated domain